MTLPSDGLVNVFFCDYGNSADVSDSELRSLLVQTQIQPSCAVE